MEGLLRSIQQRKIDRVAAAYAVAGWILVQAASIALPTFGAPLWAMKVLILAAIVGFPLALWITWYAAAPPHGLGDGIESLRRTDMALLGVLAVVLLLVAAQFAFEFHNLGTKTASAPAPHRSYFRSAASPPPTSVAVLPFLNLSGDPAKEFFSDGISEELLNDLANARNLRVAARTSSFAFKGKSEDIRQIAHALNVRSILEGSVREDGEHIRITAQLIDASNGYHVWSKTYDRDLKNILQVQDEIAQEITAALTRTLGIAPGAPRKAFHPPIDPDAYRDYLKAQALAAEKTDEGDAQAVALFKSVAEREPKFAPAFAAIGRTYVHMAILGRPKLLSDANRALSEALNVDPQSMEALYADTLVATLLWDWKRASDDAHKMRAINPHSLFTLRALTFYYPSLGFAEQQAAVLREVTRLDPLSFVDFNNLAASYNQRGLYIEAASAVQDALALKPGRPLTLYNACWAEAGMGRLDKAAAIATGLAHAGRPDVAGACRLRMAAVSKNSQQLRKLIETMTGRFPAHLFDETDVGCFYAVAGDFKTAMRWFERAYNKRSTGLFPLNYSRAVPASLLQSAAWKEMMSRPEAKRWQAAHDRLASELSKG